MSQDEGAEESEEEYDYDYEVDSENDCSSSVAAPSQSSSCNGTTTGRTTYFMNRFEYVIPDLRASETEQPHYEVERSHTLPRKCLTHVRTAEFLSIFQALRHIVRNCHAFELFLDWNYECPHEFRLPVFTVTSSANSEVVYIFNLAFQTTAEGTYPEVPPLIVPHFVMPSSVCMFTLHFPLLTARYWNPCQDLVSVLEILCGLWDSVLAKSPNDSSAMYSGTLMGGTMSIYPVTASQVESLLATSTTNVAIETLVSLWFRANGNECNYDFENLQALLEEQTASDNATSTQSTSLASVRKILLACPKPSKTRTIAAYSGTGYSTGWGESYDKAVRPLRARIMDKLYQKLCGEASALLDADQNRDSKLVRWLLGSPLLHLLSFEVSQLSSGDALRGEDDVFKYLGMLITLDEMVAKCAEPLNETQQLLFANTYSVANGLWFANGIIEVDASNSPEHNRLVAAFGRRVSSWLGDSSTAEDTEGNSGSTSSEGTKSIGKPQTSSIVQRVQYVEGLEQGHSFESESAKSPCPKFFIRELKTLSQSLSDEIFVFVSETRPNVLRVIMFVANDECPYYGGAYLFDVFIPTNYPQVSPKVNFLTTGRGTVRFNPNLYTCGKVCLSLLGTWTGEPWNPKTSNLTQVLNSILFLIFTKDPYFNEPGFLRNSTSLRESLEYDAGILYNSIQFAIKDHLQHPCRPPVVAETISNFYNLHWERLQPILLDKLEVLYSNRAMAITTYKAAKRDVITIGSLLKKNQSTNR